jgi:hypothetical protein
VDSGTTFEQEILVCHFCYFGALLDHVGDEDWAAALEGAAGIANEMVRDEPGLGFEHWTGELCPEALSMISGTTALDPKARLDIDEVLVYLFWDEDV